MNGVINKLQTYNLAKINLILYTILIVATPFIMLQNYLQGSIRNLSLSQLGMFGMKVPVLVVLFIVFLGLSVFLLRKIITVWSLGVLFVVAVLILIGQNISDYYIGFKFYDLQINWHYFAYFTFAFVAYSLFSSKLFSPAKTYLYSFLLAVFISLFDEMFQYFLSQRIFDLSDVAKDLWGVSMGLFIINYLIKNKSYHNKLFSVRQEKWKEYFRNSTSILYVIIIFSLIFLSVSSLLTEVRFGWYVFFISLLSTLFVFIIFHFYFGKYKKIINIFLLLLIVGQLVSFTLNHKKDFVFHNNFLTVYKGIALPFFDVMIYPNQTFRFVDKKIEFNQTDKKVLMKYNPDIIIIGGGKDNEGGNGFPGKDKSHFIFNPTTKSGVQVIILDSRLACIKYNELRKNGHRVLFVLHKSL